MTSEVISIRPINAIKREELDIVFFAFNDSKDRTAILLTV